MTRYIVTVLINITRGSRYFAYTPDANLAYDHDFVFTVDATDSKHAAEKVFEIGNRMTLDVDGRGWPSWVRSVSVGDVMIVTGDEIKEVLAVAGMGFETIENFDLLGPWNAPGGRDLMVASGDARPADAAPGTVTVQ